MKKKQKANLIMVAIIVVIALAGVLLVGSIQGRFDEDDGSKAVLTDIRGIINMERDGVILTVQEDTVLRAGDRLINYPGATANVKVGNTKITFGDQAELAITEPSVETFCASANSGEFFVNAEQEIQLAFEDRSITFAQSVSHLSIRTGAQSISVLEGTVDEASAGQIIDWVQEEKKITQLSINALNEFTMEQIRLANKTKALCFSNQELDNLKAQRLAEKQALLNSAGEEPLPIVTIADETEQEEEATQATEGEETEPEETEEDWQEDEDSDETQPTVKPTDPKETEQTQAPQTEPTTQPTEPEKTEPTKPEKTEPTQPDPTEPEETEAPATQPTQPEETEAPTTEPTQPENSCTITIVCDTILNNWDLLDPALAGFVPSDGVILPAVQVEFEEGETVFEVLNRVCEAYEIQLEYSWTPLYDSYYIEGIHNIYEFDCGAESGWMYKVNGWFPNYGCSSYTLKDGDAIVWCYSCIGLGMDVGGSNWQ